MERELRWFYHDDGEPARVRGRTEHRVALAHVHRHQRHRPGLEDRQHRSLSARGLSSSFTNSHSYSYGNGNINADTYSYSDLHAHGYGDVYAYGHRNLHAYAYSDCYSGNPDSDANMHTGRDLVRHFKRFWYSGG